MITTPIEVLKEKLAELEKARKKSDTAFREGGINSTLHETHVNNLTPKISEYRFAIRVLQQYT